MFSAADFADLYSPDMADVVVLAGEALPRYGLFVEAGQLEFGGEIVTTEPTLRYAVSLFPPLNRGSLLSVGGRNWKVRSSPRLLTDGKEAVVSLERVS